MLKQRTVLVLGAGASQPYGFPLGAGLVDQVAREIKGNEGGMADRLRAIGIDDRHLVPFVEALQGARPYSIDAFIEARHSDEFREVGKAAIADVLLRAEAAGGIESAEADVDWYRYLFNRYLLAPDAETFTEQAPFLTVVTFNFDRSFERALYLGTQHWYGADEEDAPNFAAMVPVHHIRGMLGVPRWMDSDAADATRYGSQGEHLVSAVPKAARQIKIVDEEIDKAVQKEAIAALKAAAHVYFLGFGFDERNLNALEAVASLRHASIQGTVLGMSTGERAPVERFFGGGLRPQIVLRNMDAIRFLREDASAFWE